MDQRLTDSAAVNNTSAGPPHELLVVRHVFADRAVGDESSSVHANGKKKCKA